MMNGRTTGISQAISGGIDSSPRILALFIYKQLRKLLYRIFAVAPTDHFHNQKDYFKKFYFRDTTPLMETSALITVKCFGCVCAAVLAVELL
jgi:hypothetical protein